jgi:hypothetical protein
MAILLAALAVDDAEKQLSDAFVTLATMRDGELLPDGSVGDGPRTLLHRETERILVHRSLLSVEIHKK